MNFLLIRHLILKEIRYQRIRLILIWLMAYLLPLANFFQDQYFYPLVDIFKTSLIVVLAITILLTWVSSIFLDPTFGSDRFLTTRPIRWTTLLASKVVFVLLFLWIPALIFRLLIVWTAGVRLSFLDQSIYLFETTLFFFAAASLIVIPALFFRRLTTLLLFIVGFVFSGYLLLLLSGVIWDALDLNTFFLLSRPYGTDPNPQLTLSLLVSGFMVACLITATTIVPVAILRYWKPSIAIPFTVTFAGFLLALVYGTTWPYSFDQLASDAPLEPDELPSSLYNKLHYSLESSTWDISRDWNGNSDYAKRTLETHLILKLHLDGITRPLFIQGQPSTVQVTLATEKKLPPSGGYPRNTYFRYDWIDDYFRQVCCGIPPANPLYENLDMTQVFSFQGHRDKNPAHDLQDRELPGATIRGDSNFEVSRLKILNVLPFKVGARQDMSRHCYEIRQIIPSEKSIEILLNNSTVPLVLRGDLKYRQSASNSPLFVVINRRTGEILDIKNDADYSNLLDGLTLQRLTLTRFHPKDTPVTEPSPSFSSNWLEDAYICFFDVEPLGKISFPFSATVTNVIPPLPEKPDKGDRHL
jgi:hypothetical protein